MIFIGDIAGQYDCLMRLVKKLPTDQHIILLGDLNDRGPKSKEVIQWAMDNQDRVTTLHSNHGHMMTDAYDGYAYYERGTWAWNGGIDTLMSYRGEEAINLAAHIREIIPFSHIDFLKSRPLFIEGSDFIATHAPINPSISFKMALDIGEDVDDPRSETSVLWNRGKIRRIPGKFQIHGHNAVKDIISYKDDQGVFGVNIDTSRGDKLTAFEYPSGEIWEEDYKI